MTIDPRTITDVQIGSKLRDAAVDPQPVDYLPPINAGEEGELGNPHGPNVVSPGVDGRHATVASLSVTPPTTSVEVGATQALVSTATLINGTTTQVVTGDTTWTTSDEAVATVDEAGLVTGVAAGSATITGTYRGKTDTIAVTVTA